ncbi:MAG TPA: LuxR C-terminal-related transcriptional regulator [Chitinophagaceae bacterium]|nr:LuxR C-terminal-related transcriptional regulator [Chitinophagaceae bacterium]
MNQATANRLKVSHSPDKFPLRSEPYYTSSDELLDKLPALIYIRDNLTGGIRWCNNVMETVMGYSRKEIISKGMAIFKELMHPDDLYLADNKKYSSTILSNFGGVIRARSRYSTDYKWYIGISTVFRTDEEGEVLEKLLIFVEFNSTTIIQTKEQINEAIRQAMSSKNKELLERLNDREKQIILLVIAGKRNLEMAKKLHLSIHTIQSYRKNIRMKLNVKNTQELIALAKNIGF